MKIIAQIIIDDLAVPLALIEDKLEHLVINGRTIISNGGIHGELRDLLPMNDTEADNVVQLPNPNEVN